MRRLPRIRPPSSRLVTSKPSISLQIVSQSPSGRAITTSPPRSSILDRFTKSKDSSSSRSTEPIVEPDIDTDSLLPEERARLREEQQRARREQEEIELAATYPETELEPTNAAEAAEPTPPYPGDKTIGASGPLVLPPSERTVAPRPSEIDDPHYEPAKDWTGLPQVGGYDGWWDRKGHWNTKFLGFAPRADQKATYKAVLEAALRRAVVEALVVWRERPEKMSAAWEVGGREDYKRALKVNIKVENGVGRVEGDVVGILKAVLPEEEPAEEEEKEEEDEDQPEQDDIVEERDEETPPDVEAESEAREAQKEKSYRGYLHITQAQKYVKSFGKEWRTIRLDDPRFKFAVAKRVYQLTANRISDFKLYSMHDVNSVLNELLKKPKPTKLIDAVWQDVAELPKLPNVRIYGRRLTPIDKDTQVGRWKVIKKELEKRALPVTGHRHLPKPVMATWIKGRA